MEQVREDSFIYMFLIYNRECTPMLCPRAGNLARRRSLLNQYTIAPEYTIRGTETGMQAGNASCSYLYYTIVFQLCQDFVIEYFPANNRKSTLNAARERWCRVLV